MNKLGVRLIALLFFILAITNIHRLIIGASSKEFFGLGLTHNGEKLILMAWAQIAVLIYIGIQLLRFHPSGRYGALAVLWLGMFGAGWLLIWLGVPAVKAFYHNETIELYYITWFGEIRGLAVLLFYIGLLIYFFIPAYSLMRKDTKILFQSVEKSETSPMPTQDVEPR